MERRTLPFMTGLAHQKYLPAEEGIIDAAKSGCSHWYIDGSLHGEMVHEWPENRIHQLNDLISLYSCRPIFHGNFKVPLASDVKLFSDSAVKYVMKEIDLCAKISAPCIIHGGAIVEPKAILKAKKIALNNYLQSLHILSDYAANKGVDLYLENLSNYKFYRPFHYIFTHFEEYSYIFENLQQAKNVFFFLDVGHSNIGNSDTIQVFESFHSRIKGVSLSNNNGSQDQHLPIEQGNINYKDLIRSMLNKNWQGLVAFETRGIETKETFDELVKLYQHVLSEDLNCYQQVIS